MPCRFAGCWNNVPEQHYSKRAEPDFPLWHVDCSRTLRSVDLMLVRSRATPVLHQCYTSATPVLHTIFVELARNLNMHGVYRIYTVIRLYGNTVYKYYIQLCVYTVFSAGISSRICHIRRALIRFWPTLNISNAAKPCVCQTLVITLFKTTKMCVFACNRV
jgi:hypothetical protein